MANNMTYQTTNSTLKNYQGCLSPDEAQTPNVILMGALE
jgi:hypothetical protein